MRDFKPSPMNHGKGSVAGTTDTSGIQPTNSVGDSVDG